MKIPILFQEEEEKEGTQKSLGFRDEREGNKTKEKWQKDTACVGAYNDCHEYYALSSAFNEIVLGVAMSYTS